MNTYCKSLYLLRWCQNPMTLLHIRKIKTDCCWSVTCFTIIIFFNFSSPPTLMKRRESENLSFHLIQSNKMRRWELLCCYLMFQQIFPLFVQPLLPNRRKTWSTSSPDEPLRFTLLFTRERRSATTFAKVTQVILCKSNIEEIH